MAFVFAGIVFMFTLLFALGSSLSNSRRDLGIGRSCTGCVLVVGISVSVLISATHYINWPW